MRTDIPVQVPGIGTRAPLLSFPRVAAARGIPLLVSSRPKRRDRGASPRRNHSSLRQHRLSFFPRMVGHEGEPSAQACGIAGRAPQTTHDPSTSVAMTEGWTKILARAFLSSRPKRRDRGASPRRNHRSLRQHRLSFFPPMMGMRVNLPRKPPRSVAARTSTSVTERLSGWGSTCCDAEGGQDLFWPLRLTWYGRIMDRYGPNIDQINLRSRCRNDP